MSVMKYQIFDSWKKMNGENKCIKVIDKSFVVSGTTGIPKGMRSFWEIEDWKQLHGKSKIITIEYRQQSFASYLTVKQVHTGSPRTSLVVKKALVYALIQEQPNLLGSELFFEKVNANYFRVYLDAEDSIQASVQDDHHIEVGNFATNKEHIEQYSLQKECNICKFSFAKTYGNYANLEELYTQYYINETESILLCPNCYGALKKIGSNNIDVLKEIIEKNEEEETWQLLDDTKVFI